MKAPAVGIVRSVNAAECTVRVHYDDVDIVSGELPVLQPNAGANATYSMPNIGDQVLVAFSGDDAEDGFVIGSMYSEADVPEAGDLWHIKLADGSKLSYSDGKFKLQAEGGIDIEGATTITGDTQITGDVHIVGALYVTGLVTAAGFVTA